MLKMFLYIGVGVAILTGGVLTASSESVKTMNSRQVDSSAHFLTGVTSLDKVMTWDTLKKVDDVTNGQDFAHFVFSFTNIGKGVVEILNVHPSCGCTTVELPPVPWKIAAGSEGVIRIKVNLHGKHGKIFKSVNIATDRGNKTLTLEINIDSRSLPEMTGEQRASGIAAAKVDRQAVFKGKCASCHAKNLSGRYGRRLFAATCSICHEAKHRATMVPDLHSLKVPTDEAFWRTWIASGKAGTLMPAFAKSQGGPLTDLQIASLAAYLNAVNPSPANASIAN